MDNFQTFAFLVFCLGLTQAVPLQAGQLPACQADSLADAISFFVAAVNNARDAVSEVVDLGPDEDPFRFLADIGYDVNTDSGVQALACFIDSIDSIEDLAAVFGEDVETFRPGYDFYIGIFNHLGGMEGLREIAHMEINHFQWVLQNDAMNLPLQLSPVEVWNHIYEIMQMPGFERLVGILMSISGGQPFMGMGMTVEELTRVLMNAQNVEDLGTALDVDPMFLETLQQIGPVIEDIFAVALAYLGIMQEQVDRGFTSW